MTGNRILLGKIAAPWGLKGWVKIWSWTDPIEQIFEYRQWFLVRGERQERVELAEGKRQGRGLVALLSGFEDRNHAEAAVGCEVWIDEENLPELDEGEYYWYQLEGLTVVSETGEVLGRVHHLLATGANDVLVIRGDGQDGELLIPYVEKEIVKKVSLREKRIVVAWEREY